MHSVLRSYFFVSLVSIDAGAPWHCVLEDTHSLQYRIDLYNFVTCAVKVTFRGDALCGDELDIR